MIRGVHHFAIHVHDMDRMIKFYNEAFGFEVVGEPFSWQNDEFIDRIVDVKGSAAKGAMLRAGTCYIEMFQYSAPPPQNEGPLRPSDRGYTHFCIDVTEMEKDIEHLRKCGMTFNERDFVDVGHVKTLYGYDPEGNVIEVQQTAANNGFTLEELKARAG